MNILFWTILAALAVAGGFQVWFRRRHDDETVADSPVDNFKFTRDDDWPLQHGEWSLEDVEFLGSSARVRAVVTIEIDCREADRRRRALEKLAREVYRHTEVEAVFIQARRPENDPDLYLFAADGRGWWGDQFLSTAISGADF